MSPISSTDTISLCSSQNLPPSISDSSVSPCSGTTLRHQPTLSLFFTWACFFFNFLNFLTEIERRKKGWKERKNIVAIGKEHLTRKKQGSGREEEKEKEKRHQRIMSKNMLSGIQLLGFESSICYLLAVKIWAI